MIRIYKAHPEARIGVRRMQTLARRVMQAEGWDFPVNVVVTDDAQLQALHARFLRVDTPTDVMSFPGDPQDDFPAEVYISLDQARAQAREDGEPVSRALDRLMVHGLLHLGGWTDDTDAQRSRMIAYGERYVQGG